MRLRWLGWRRDSVGLFYTRGTQVPLQLPLKESGIGEKERSEVEDSKISLFRHVKRGGVALWGSEAVKGAAG